jgi:hypothetical protein
LVDEILENLNAIYWMIGGKRFVVLQERGFLRDVMQLSTIADDASACAGK